MEDRPVGDVFLQHEKEKNRRSVTIDTVVVNVSFISARLVGLCTGKSINKHAITHDKQTDLCVQRFRNMFFFMYNNEKSKLYT